MAQNKPAEDFIMTEWELYFGPPVVSSSEKKWYALKQTTITSFFKRKDKLNEPFNCVQSYYGLVSMYFIM